MQIKGLSLRRPPGFKALIVTKEAMSFGFRAIRPWVEDFSYPRTNDWLEMVAMRSRQVVRQALAGPAAGPA